MFIKKKFNLKKKRSRKKRSLYYKIISKNVMLYLINSKILIDI